MCVCFCGVTGKGLDVEMTLNELGVGPNGTVQLEITSSDPGRPIKALPAKKYQMPDVITVRVPTGNRINSSKICL